MTDTIKMSKLGFLAFLLSLLTIASVGYLYYNQINSNKLLKTQIEMLHASNNAQDKANQNMQNELSNSISKIDNQVNSLSGKQNSVIIFQLNQLISLANQGLIVYGDIEGSIRILNYAKEMLDGNNDPIFTGVKFAITGDITKLESRPKVDSVIINGELDSLVSVLSNMSLDKESQASASTKDTKLKQFWLNIKESLLSLIRVKRVSAIDLDRSLPIAIDDIRMDILGAKLAILQHDEVSFEYNLKMARQILGLSFANYTGFKEIDSKLEALQKINISNTSVNIDATVKELNKLNNLK